MKQVIVGGKHNALFGAATEYNCLMGGISWNATESNVYQVVPTGGTISKLYVELSGDVAADASVTFTLMVAGEATVLTCTVVAGASTASDLVHSVDVVAGDTVSLRCTYTGTPGSLKARWTTIFEGTTAGESICLLNTSAALYAVYSVIQGHSVDVGGGESAFQVPMPTVGSFRKLYVQLSADPGTAPDAYSFTLIVDGVSSALTTTIVADNTDGNDTEHTVDVTAGQLVNIEVTPVDTPTVVPIVAIGMVFVSDTDGESLIIGGDNSETSGSGTTQYNQLLHAGAGWYTGESSRYSLIQVCTIRKLYVSLVTAPGGEQTQTVSIRIGGADSGLTVTITGEETTGNDVVHTASPTAGQTGGIKIVPSATAAATYCHIGLVCYIAPPQHYDRSATALLGLKSTATRVGVLSRSKTALLGLLSTGSRTIVYPRTGTALLGLLPTASRVITLTRTDTALLGLLTTGSRAVAYAARIGTALLGLKITASRLVSYPRVGTALLGLKASASRVMALSRTDVALLGLKATASRVIALSRAKTALLGLKTTAWRIIAGRHYIRSATALLGLKATGTRTVARTRTSTALLGLKTTATFKLSRMIKVITAEGSVYVLKTIAGRIYGIMTREGRPE